MLIWKTYKCNIKNFFSSQNNFVDHTYSENTVVDKKVLHKLFFKEYGLQKCEFKLFQFIFWLYHLQAFFSPLYVLHMHKCPTNISLSILKGCKCELDVFLSTI